MIFFNIFPLKDFDAQHSKVRAKLNLNKAGSYYPLTNALGVTSVAPSKLPLLASL
ncbi:hypothetical protein [Brunnivagina elsteri]|uniref:hypothetical protein n=1 Tax=Brunnivagina elsteri TaxID=1247191 RepID=UPI0013044A89|nr:hypothetical protein [Calothrix elsteri]